jgi:hypothetical protein
MNKKAEIAVNLLVFLALSLTLIALASFFLNSNKINAEIYGLNIVEKALYQEKEAEFYLEEAGEKALIKTYNNFILNYDFIANPVVRNSNNIAYFANLDLDWRERFEKQFILYLKEDFSGYEFEEDYLKDFKNIVDNLDEGDIFFEKDSLRIIPTGWQFENSFKGLKINYSPEILIDLNLTKIGLYDFEYLHQKMQSCKENPPGIALCLEENSENFKVVAEGEALRFTSNKEFFIDGGFKKIEFIFIPKFE